MPPKIENGASLSNRRVVSGAQIPTKIAVPKIMKSNGGSKRRTRAKETSDYITGNYEEEIYAKKSAGNPRET
jgi:hypothetical protein